MTPGLTEFTKILLDAKSRANVLVNPLIACLVEAN